MEFWLKKTDLRPVKLKVQLFDLLWIVVDLLTVHNKSKQVELEL